MSYHNLIPHCVNALITDEIGFQPQIEADSVNTWLRIHDVKDL